MFGPEVWLFKQQQQRPSKVRAKETKKEEKEKMKKKSENEAKPFVLACNKCVCEIFNDLLWL